MIGYWYWWFIIIFGYAVNLSYHTGDRLSDVSLECSVNAYYTDLSRTMQKVAMLSRRHVMGEKQWTSSTPITFASCSTMIWWCQC